MNKIFLTSIASLALVFPTMANIDKDASTATCNSATIGATSGSAYMDTDWTANTINLDFYSDGEKISTGSCTYDGTIELPNDPEDKTGYTFGGWKVRVATGPAQCNISDITSLNTSTNGSAYAFINLNGTASTANSSGTRKTPDAYNIANDGEWAVEFEYGTIKGISRCSTVGSGYKQGQTGNPTDDLNAEGAQYCWCQLSGFDSDKDGEYCAVSSLWAFFSSYSNCASACANGCTTYVRNFSNLRAGLFGSVAQ